MSKENIKEITLDTLLSVIEPLVKAIEATNKVTKANVKKSIDYDKLKQKLNRADAINKMLGKPSRKVKGITIDHLVNHYKLAKDGSFISEKIDIQKAIDSENVTTFSYLLKKYDLTNERVKGTIDRLISLNKSGTDGKLFDANGSLISTKEKASEMVEKYKADIIKSKLEFEKYKKDLLTDEVKSKDNDKVKEVENGE